MNKKFYLTNAIPYVNAPPHLGHVLELVQSDTIARYHHLLGQDTYFLFGSDENSLKNVQAAEEEKISTQELVNKNSKKFKDLKKVLNLSFDDFIRTTEKRHIEGAQKLWLSCQKEDIYKKNYKGLYCLGCEAFYTEKDLVNGKCPEHNTKPEVIEEENYFFRLSKYQDFLKDLISKDKLKIIPQTRKNEVLAFIERGLEDFSISRSKKRVHNWGVPVPCDPKQIMWCWFDALANYITALNWQNNGQLFQKYWPADVHMIGKGISRFHAIYWPAMLQSAGLPLPKEIFVHGYVTVNGQKISKSLGNTINPFALVKKYGTDPIRYYLLKEIPAYDDGDFSEKRFQEVYNADLANGLGNLVARIAKLCEKANFEAKCFNDLFRASARNKVLEQSERSLNYCSKLNQLLNEFKFDEALKFIWEKISEADHFLDKNKPWLLNDDRLNEVLSDLASKVKEISILLQPFLPETSEKIQKQFAGPKIKSENPLFPRLR